MIRRFRYRLSDALWTIGDCNWRKTCHNPFDPTLIGRLWGLLCHFAGWVSPWRRPPPAGDAR